MKIKHDYALKDYGLMPCAWDAMPKMAQAVCGAALFLVILIEAYSIGAMI